MLIEISCRSDADVLELRRRYTNLYVPSDFFYTRIRWSDSFPAHTPFSIQKPSAFHVFHRKVEALQENEAEFEPADVDHKFSAKVSAFHLLLGYLKGYQRSIPGYADGRSIYDGILSTLLRHSRGKGPR